MKQGQSILVVVPARGGSKGVPLKNLHPVGGIPLLAHTGRLVSGLAWVDRAVVSTDHEGIASEAENCGLAAPFRRSEALAGDRIGDLEVLREALTECERIDGRRYDIVVMLQPTSPLRKAAHVEDTVDRLIEGGFDSVWTVSPTDLKYHPRKQLLLEDGALSFFDPAGAGVIARQQLAPIYHRNGAAYAFTRGCLLDHGSIMGENASAVVIEEPMISIDTLEDFAQVEQVLAGN